MSMIVWITMLVYISIAVLFNLSFLYVYREDKSGWTDSDGANKIGMFMCSVLWPIHLLYGLFKMKGEDK